MKKRIFSLWLLMLVLLMGTAVYAAAPKMNAKITQKNVMALAKATDADGAYILQNGFRRGENVLAWWMSADTIAAGMDTAVHEQFHQDSLARGGDYSENIYIGNKKYCRVKYTKVFPSRKMAAAIPKALRTYRWADYVGKPEEGMFANEMGAYGLLNEFAAYYWGMHAQMSMLDYYMKQKTTVSQWEEFVVNCANDRVAYAEFRYYILMYLLYAKQNEPSVYRGIAANRSFAQAYLAIDRDFAGLIREFEDQTDEIEARMKEQGYDVCIQDTFRVVKDGGFRDTDLFAKEYRKLIAETKKTKYQGLLITKSSGGERLKSPAIRSLKSDSAGTVTVKWSSVPEAAGYQICYSADRKFSAMKTVNVKAPTLSVKLSPLKKGRSCYVKVCAYRKSGKKTSYSLWSGVSRVKIKK